MTAPTIPAQGDTSTSVIRTSAAQFKNQTEFISHVQNTIAKTTSFRELFYTQVPLAWGKAIVDYLNKNREGCGSGPYSGSRKEPDCYILAKNLPLPRLVIETGWSESHNRLLDDMNTWLVGGNGHV
ncbi:hypothetical protein EMCG_00350 [[Emmonsia] crescens]|uniref:Uncharacterized protein n=1 Tax=[Emmonsia] crescens TaxID=73230 RepID=A0A0G2HWN4_9EURO|nr:hypothetical protein EMCG_00350 [Emmonsia crescens UAMH 3008]